MIMLRISEPAGGAAGSNFSDFLRACRVRIDPQTRLLGSFVRQAKRVGRPVSQEEASEAIGVTRQWYAMMEGHTGARISMRALGRLADAFMLDPFERTMLFQLARPELLAHLMPLGFEDAHATRATG